MTVGDISALKDIMTLCSVCRGPLPTHVSLTLARSVLEAERRLTRGHPKFQKAEAGVSCLGGAERRLALSGRCSVCVG